MPRALNQTLAWVISGGISAAIFGGIVGMMLSAKPDSSEHVGSEHSRAAAEHKAEGSHEEHSASGTAGSDHAESAPSESKGEHGDTHASHEGSESSHSAQAEKSESHPASKNAHDGGEEVEIKADSFHKK